MLCIQLLGTPQIDFNNRVVSLDRRKALALLAYLAVTGQPHTREALAARFWADYDQSSAFAYLRRELYTLNSTFGEGWITLEGDTVQLSQREEVWIDVADFRAELTRTHTHSHPPGEVCEHCIAPLNAAVELYRGDFLAGFTLRDCPEFDEWQAYITENLKQQVINTLEKLAMWHGSQGAFQTGIDYAQRLLALDPLHEPAHRQLMRLYAEGGYRTAALRQYEECVRLLQNELATQPEPETEALHQAILEGRFHKPVSSEAPPSKLPAQASPFVGRERELAEIERRLSDPQCRLLTLVGAGGIGKTRLAIEAASRQRFTDGVYFFSLQGMNSVEMLLPLIIEAVRFTGPTSRDEQKSQLYDYLATKQVLFVIDNFEHLLDGANFLTHMLQKAPQIKLLVTSRERLNLQSEWVIEVSSMAVPHRSVTNIEEYGSVQLFLQSAMRAGFTPTEDDRPYIAQICRLVEGIPLGLELAASWTKVLTCKEIAEEIRQSIDFLSTTMRDLPERHRSFRAVFEHSWSLLSEDQRELLVYLSIFRGGFKRDAAVQIADASLPLLSALVDKSLLHRAGTGRYEIHELVRQYAEEKLDPAKLAAMRQCHAEYYLGWMEALEPDFKNHRQKETLRAVTEEIENVGAAWVWAAEHGKVDLLQKGMPLALYYDLLDLVNEGIEKFKIAMAGLRRVPLDPAGQLTLAYVLGTYGRLLVWRDEEAVAYPLLQEALQLAEQHNGAIEQALAHLGLGYHNKGIGDYPTAEQHFRAAYRILETHDDLFWRVWALLALATSTTHRGEYEESQRLYDLALQFCRQQGEKALVAACLTSLGNITRLQGKFEESRAYLEESSAILRELELPYGWANSLSNLSLAYKALGRYDDAERVTEEAYRLYTSERFSNLGLACIKNDKGVLARVRGRYAEARRWHEDALRLFKQINSDWGMGFALNDLGTGYMLTEQPGKAEQYHREALAVCRKSDNRYDLAVSLNRLGLVIGLQGRYAEALPSLQEALQIAQAINIMPIIVEIVASFGQLYWHMGERERGLELLSAALYCSQAEYETRQNIRAFLQSQGIDVPSRPTTNFEALIKRLLSEE